MTPIAYTGIATALKNIRSAFFASFIAVVPESAQFRRWKTEEKEHWIARRWSTWRADEAAAAGGDMAAVELFRKVVLHQLPATVTVN